MMRMPRTERIGSNYCNDRGIRSAYNAFARSSIAHDASYTDVVSVFADTLQCGVDAVASVLASHDAARLAANPILNGSRCARGLVACDTTPQCAIASVDVLFRPSSRNVVSKQQSKRWLWVHPSVSKAVASAIQVSSGSTTNVRVLRNELQTFHIYGPVLVF